MHSITFLPEATMDTIRKLTVKQVQRPKSHHVELVQGACGVCNTDVIVQPFSKVQDTFYHQNCFVCHQCLEPFKDGLFYNVDDHLYCEFDFLVLHGHIQLT